MANKKFSKSESDPTSRNYPKIAKNKANEKSPYGEDEPSPCTTYK
ncbi:hypothetical protein psyc5s11_26900 [Clostridium gelidum]|uniref:Uncharacterized protein n=1 Tax=Clostridium gelidum TaxID=704125 RepID=A0ABN6IYX6_9CLOT|nr:hypothetical protein [Clostridium gelidum]BCZ46623.1 hypothetical protein psyc5s11_26900 [Clostridium gelidum]